MNGPAIVVVSADSPTSGKDAWVSSVHGEHWKRHADMGFSGFRHFENMPGHPDNVGDLGEPPDHLFVYELPDVTIAFGEEYRKLAASYEEEPWRDLGRGSHGVYGQIFQYPPPRDHYSFGHTGHIFFSRADCPPEYAEEYSAYYDTEHIPLVFDEIPGFVTARRFASAPEPVPSGHWSGGFNTTHLAFYDIVSEEVFQNPIFRTFTPTPWQARMKGIRVLRNNSIFREAYRSEA